jgi:hypothetical protein
MGVSREKLYEEIWAEPMTTVAARYEVSSNYLARVCEHLNIPRPPRGYWAKLQFQKAPKRPKLGEARPGEVLAWAKGDSIPHVRQPSAHVTPPDKPDASAEPSGPPERHALLRNAKEAFETARLSEVGYLRPRKRNLVDIFVSSKTLSYALDTANDLFIGFESRGCRVALASGNQAPMRPELAVFEGQKFDYHNREPWSPGLNTVLFVREVAFGLTLYEATEHVEVSYEWSRPVRYVRVSELPPKRRPAWAYTPTPTKEHMPCGLLALRVYSPYSRVSWEERWRESHVGDLKKKIAAIVRTCREAVPVIQERREVARKQAEEEHQRWEEQRREYERKERERRRIEALNESRQELAEIIDAWEEARGVEGFFEDAERRAQALSADDREVVLDRVRRARTMLGGIDALARLRDGKAPDER